MQGIAKDSTLYPTFSATTVSAMQDSANKYVDNLFFSGGSLQTLLTDDHAYVNDALADIYGVASPGADLALVQVDGTQRSGMLTNVGLMAALAHETADSPVLRGVFVLSSIICHALPPPPAGVNTAVPAPSTTAPMTTRENFATQHEQGACAACHHTIDGIGFGFEHYDATGKWRTEEYNLPIDSSGWFTSDYDAALTGTFDGAIDLGHRLAQSSTVQSCVAQNWLRYALGVDHTGVDSKGLTPIVAAFQRGAVRHAGARGRRHAQRRLQHPRGRSDPMMNRRDMLQLLGMAGAATMLGPRAARAAGAVPKRILFFYAGGSFRQLTANGSKPATVQSFWAPTAPGAPDPTTITPRRGRRTSTRWPTFISRSCHSRRRCCSSTASTCARPMSIRPAARTATSEARRRR